MSSLLQMALKFFAAKGKQNTRAQTQGKRNLQVSSLVCVLKTFNLCTRLYTRRHFTARYENSLFYPFDSCFIIIIILFYPQSKFYPWSAVCSLHFTLSLHFTPGLQSAVCSLRFTLTVLVIDRGWKSDREIISGICVTVMVSNALSYNLWLLHVLL